MPIILDEEKIIFWFQKIQLFEKDIHISKVLNLLHFTENSIESYNCEGTCKFLGHIVTNIWTDFITYLQDLHPDILRKIQTTNLLEDATTHLSTLKNYKKRDPWLLHFTTKHFSLSNCLEKICLTLELANELLFSPITDNPWIEKIVREDQQIRRALSIFLGDINIHNLENLMEL